MKNNSLFGQVIEVKDTVIILCRLREKFFECRSFDSALAGHFKVNDYVEINFEIIPGKSVCTITKSRLDVSTLDKLFEQDDVFKGLEGSAFFTKD